MTEIALRTRSPTHPLTHSLTHSHLQWRDDDQGLPPPIPWGHLQLRTGLLGPNGARGHGSRR